MLVAAARGMGRAAAEVVRERQAAGIRGHGRVSSDSSHFLPGAGGDADYPQTAL